MVPYSEAEEFGKMCKTLLGKEPSHVFCARALPLPDTQDVGIVQLGNVHLPIIKVINRKIGNNFQTPINLLVLTTQFLLC